MEDEAVFAIGVGIARHVSQCRPSRSPKCATPAPIHHLGKRMGGRTTTNASTSPRRRRSPANRRPANQRYPIGIRAGDPFARVPQRQTDRCRIAHTSISPCLLVSLSPYLRPTCAARITTCGSMSCRLVAPAPCGSGAHANPFFEVAATCGKLPGRRHANRRDGGLAGSGFLDLAHDRRACLAAGAQTGFRTERNPPLILPRPWWSNSAANTVVFFARSRQLQKNQRRENQEKRSQPQDFWPSDSPRSISCDFPANLLLHLNSRSAWFSDGIGRITVLVGWAPRQP